MMAIITAVKIRLGGRAIMLAIMIITVKER